MRTNFRTFTLCVFAAAPVLLAGTANADVMARGQSGGREATVIFGVSGDELRVTLTNSALSDVLEPADVLTAVFFDIPGLGSSLTPISAVISDGSSVQWGNSEVGGGVGGEWAFRAGLVGAPSAAAYGISAAGLGLFGPQDSFPGANLDGQEGPQGLNFGLLTAGDNLATGNTPVTGSVPLVRSSVTFTLSGLPGGFDAGTISNVSVQYGTSLSEPSFSTPLISAPAPGAAAGLGLAIGLAGMRRRRLG